MGQQLTFAAPMAPQVGKLRPGMFSPTYVPPTPGYRPPAPTTVIAPSAPARTLGATPEVIEPDLFFIAQGVTCEAWDGMVVAEQQRRIARHYGIAETGPVMAAFLSKYRGNCGWRPGRALAALGLTCAQWQLMENTDRVLRLMQYASPMRTAALAAFIDYADAVTAYCAGGVAPGGQVQTPVFVEPLADKLTFWRVSFVLAAGTAAALALRLRSVTKKRK